MDQNLTKNASNPVLKPNSKIYIAGHRGMVGSAVQNWT